LFLSPVGGSLVNLIDLSRREIGIPAEGSADKKSLNSGLIEESSCYLSRIFSSSRSQTGIK
jgi:hypothetical protein